MMNRMTWDQMCRTTDYQGRWIAIEGCRYDDTTGRAAEGSVVDVDADLADLCNRVRESHFRNCAILYCRNALRPD